MAVDLTNSPKICLPRVFSARSANVVGCGRPNTSEIIHEQVATYVVSDTQTLGFQRVWVPETTTYLPTSCHFQVAASKPKT